MVQTDGCDVWTGGSWDSYPFRFRGAADYLGLITAHCIASGAILNIFEFLMNFYDVKLIIDIFFVGEWFRNANGVLNTHHYLNTFGVLIALTSVSQLNYSEYRPPTIFYMLTYLNSSSSLKVASPQLSKISDGEFCAAIFKLIKRLNTIS
uniref:Uncharacterized protein n=1 Tax=Glossina austeni TaxID=7395 RepID=A0A1A9UEF9_GLOAU